MPTLDQTYTTVKTALGLTSESSCEYSEILQSIREQTKDLADETKEAVDLISAKSMGNFLGVFGVLMSDLFSGAGNAMVELTVDKMLFENVLSATVAAVTMAITAIPSFEIILIYLAAKQLSVSLTQRIQLSEILVRELGYLLAFMDALGDLFDSDFRDIAFPEITKSLGHVKTASRLVASEYIKTVSNDTTEKLSLNVSNLDIAKNEINLAIDDLTGGNYSVFSNELVKIHNEYGLEIPTITNSLATSSNFFEGLSDYMTGLKTAIKDKYYGDNFKENRQTIVTGLLRKVFNVFPEFIRLVLLKEIVSESTDILIKKFPVWLSLNASNREEINKRLKIPDTIIDNIFPEIRTKNVDPFFTDNKTKDLTWLVLMMAGKTAEAALLLFPTNWEFLNAAAGIGRSILWPAHLNLLKVKNTMQTFIATEEDKSFLDIQGHKVSWNTDLVGARNLLNLIIGDQQLSVTIGGTAYEFNPTATLSSFSQATLALDSLESYIVEKHTAPKEPGDTAFELAQRFLGPLSFDVVILLTQSPYFTAGVQSIRVALNEQITKDAEELVLANNLIHKIEAIASFPALRRILEELLEGLGDKLNIANINETLKKGDLSGLVDVLDDTARATEGIGFIKCLSEKEGVNIAFLENWGKFFGISLEKGYGIDKLKEWVSYKDKSLAALSDKYQVLQSAEKQVEELMA